MKRRKFSNRHNKQSHGLSGLLKWQYQKLLRPIEKPSHEEPFKEAQDYINRVNSATFVNHSTFILNINGTIILTDPIWSEYCSPIQGFGPKRIQGPGIKLDSLPKVDIVLISHNHYDHLDYETLSKLKRLFDPHFCVPLGDGELLKKMGTQKVTEFDWWQEEVKCGLPLTFLPAEHFSGRALFDQNQSLWGSWAIRDAGQFIYFAGDTGYSKHFSEIRNFLKDPITLSLLPIGAYLPRWFMKPVHMSPQDACQAHLDLGSHKSIAMHFGTFLLADDRPDEVIEDFQKAKDYFQISEEEFSLPTGAKSFAWNRAHASGASQ